MDYNELRITNKVYNIASGSKEICEIEAITRLGVQYNSETRQGTCSMDNLEPIILNEEWLINLGFERIGQNFRKCEDHGYGLGMTEFVVWFNTNKKTYNIKAINILVGIETVHNLQNVYHSLTGKELTHQKIN